MIKNITLKSLALAGILSAGNLSAQDIKADDSNIQYTGRIDFSNPLAPKYKYPGISIKAKFNGTGINAVIDDSGTGTVAGANFYKVFIDGQIVTEQVMMSSGEATYTLASGLSAGDHTVEIMKITEGAAGISSFKGFTVAGGNQTLLPLPAKSDKKIEFIGDSWTCGFGNLSQYASGSASMAFGNFQAENEDNYYAWGPRTARNLGAQYHVTAVSGRGLFRNNFNNGNDGYTGTLPKMYDYTMEDLTNSTWNHNEFHPDVVVIHLGTNDMAAEEGGQSYQLDDQKFEDTYIEFVDHIFTQHPCATVLMCYGNSKSNSYPTWTQQLNRLKAVANNVEAHFANSGGKIDQLELPYTAESWPAQSDDCGYGDAWHPSLCSHEEMSVVLTDKINSLSINWGNNQGCTYSEEEVAQMESMKVFPNPAANHLNIQLKNPSDTWTITNMVGIQVQQGKGAYASTTNLPNGMYFITESNGKWSAKFLKK